MEATHQHPSGPDADLYLRTLRGLLTPRRAIPIAFVCGALVTSQIQLAVHPGEGWLAAFMCVAFLGSGPYLWRRLNPMGQPPGVAGMRLLIYVLAGFSLAFLMAEPLPALLGVGPTLMTSEYTSYISLALFWVGGWGLGRDLDYEESLLREQARATDLEREAQRAQLLAVRSHLDPHFLFNTLNAIAEWCRQDGEVAEQAILKLSAMLRTVLSGVPLAYWSLRKELELADAYLELYLVRDPRMFEIVREVRVEPMAVDVPPLILLPLIENAVKYGPAAGQHGTIELTIDDAHGMLRIVIENPGTFQGLREDGTGYRTVEKRLALAYDSSAHIDIAAVGDRTRVTVRIPRGEQPQQA